MVAARTTYLPIVDVTHVTLTPIMTVTRARNVHKQSKCHKRHSFHSWPV
jgi:hypothetical protein